MKYLRKIFESDEDDKRYIEECFLDVLENSNFEVGDLLEVELTEQPGLKSFQLTESMSIYKLHIELGKTISLSNPVSSNLYIGMLKTDLNFLKMKNEKM